MLMQVKSTILNKVHITQANPKSTKSEVYGGDIAKQYANGSYAEVWFKEATVGESTMPNN